jgi:hypothetical protein
MASTPSTTETAPSPVQQIPPAEEIRRRLADLSHERSLLRQLLRVAVRRERSLPEQPVEEASCG